MRIVGSLELNPAKWENFVRIATTLAAVETIATRLLLRMGDIVSRGTRRPTGSQPHERLSEPLRLLLTDPPCQDVGCAAAYMSIGQRSALGRKGRNHGSATRLGRAEATLAGLWDAARNW